MDIRAEFLKFFEQKGHELTPSAPLVPHDATLLFTNAGMVPFKSIFTGEVPRPNPPRRTSCQTCIRAGGKHNDLDNVGYTARHHTFFEMLGNFSFGDYFKKDAISFAWEFVSEVAKLPKEKLYATVHESDDEAYEIWLNYLPKERIYRFGDKDNFWQMGDTDEDYMGGDGDRFLEIWNLVFMQYERSSDGTLTPLPKPSIDTGMGLERMIAVSEGKFSNYDSSLFMPLIEKVAKLCNKPYEYESGASYRVIADHIRSVCFLLAQGTNFGRDGREYVLRRILRRAVRHGYLLGITEPFMYKLVDTLVVQMGGHYEYLQEKKEAIKEAIKLEEERFFATIEAGLALFNEELKNTKEVFSGEVAFKLYDTHGFPLDLTADMLREKNLKLDVDKFDELMEKQKQNARASWKGSGDKLANGDFKSLLEEFGVNKFTGYEKTEQKSKILSLLDEEYKRVEHLENQKGWVMLDHTPFYAQSGGQCGDVGTIEGNAVLDTQKFYELNLSCVDAQKSLCVGDTVKAKVDASRNEIKKHHSATHLLHSALREILGEHVAQAGSSVEKDRLRFDFSHPKALSKEELESIENYVNSIIANSVEGKTELMSIEEAKNSGAIALFGEKYADEVRVVSFGEQSSELCGGTHVQNAGLIGSFFITKESGVSAGVRRIEAVCGQSALNYAKSLQKQIQSAKQELKANDLHSGIKNLQKKIDELKIEIKELEKANKTELKSEKVGDTTLIVSELSVGDIKKQIDDIKNAHEKVAVIFFQKKGEKVLIAAGVKNASLKAGEWIKNIAPIVGGGGGGRDDFAQAGGKDASKLDLALKKASEFAKEHL